MLMKWLSWLICGFPFLSLPSAPQCLVVKAGLSLHCNKKRRPLFLWKCLVLIFFFSKARVIKQIQEDQNSSFYFIFSAGFTSFCFLPSLTEKMPHGFIAYWVAHCSIVHLAMGSPLQLCPVIFLPWPYLCMYQCAGSR